MGQIDLYEDGRTKRKLEPRTVLKRLAIAIACAVLVYGGIRLYSWALPRIHYAGLDRQEWREDMEPGCTVSFSGGSMVRVLDYYFKNPVYFY